MHLHLQPPCMLLYSCGLYNGERRNGEREGTLKRRFLSVNVMRRRFAVVVGAWYANL